MGNADKMRLEFNKRKLSLSLIFLRPNIEPLGFWAVLWAVGITSFIIKFLCMGIKCLILLLPSSLITFRTQVRKIDFFFHLLHCCVRKKMNNKKIYIRLHVIALLIQLPFFVCLCPQGSFMMLTEELSQVHQAIAPVSLWFQYLVTYQEADGTPGLTLGILLALTYLILKVYSL